MFEVDGERRPSQVIWGRHSDATSSEALKRLSKEEAMSLVVEDLADDFELDLRFDSVGDQYVPKMQSAGGYPTQCCTGSCGCSKTCRITWGGLGPQACMPC